MVELADCSAPRKIKQINRAMADKKGHKEQNHLETPNRLTDSKTGGEHSRLERCSSSKQDKFDDESLKMIEQVRDFKAGKGKTQNKLDS